jgi:hypothetical protein
MGIENLSLIQIKNFYFLKHHFIDLFVDGFDRISKKKSNKAFPTSLTLDKNHLLSPQSFHRLL